MIKEESTLPNPNSDDSSSLQDDFSDSDSEKGFFVGSIYH